MINFSKIMAVLLVIIIFTACSHQSSSTKKSETIVVSLQPLSTTLYYSGMLQPLGGVVVTTPADGVIQEMNFHYGDIVKAGDLLFTIISEKFFSDYKTAVMQYIKAKSEFSTSQSQLTQTEFLYKNELISSDALREKKNSFYNSQLSFLQAKDSLTILFKQLDLKGINPYDIKIEEISKIIQALQVQGDMQKIKITAPVTGVMLFPGKSEDGGDASRRVEKGEKIKQGDILALISDLNGMRMRINVNEFNINQLNIGQEVKVTGVAFPGVVLRGKIIGIDRQAQTGQGGAPLFSTDILIPKLTQAEQKIIHVGMNAKVEINLEGKKRIMLPLAAVYEKKGITYVKVKDPHTLKIKEVIVKTGETTMNSVVIEEGLKPGDQVSAPLLTRTSENQDN